MKKIAIFGKPGGGKSTLGETLSLLSGVPVYSLDLIAYNQNGERISVEEYSAKHAELLCTDSWIIEGLGTFESFWARIDAADTLVYVDLPYVVHYWWTVKRLLKHPFAKPAGWPVGSSILKGTLMSWKYLRLSHKFWTAELYKKIQERGNGKNIFRVGSVKQLNDFAQRVGGSFEASANR